MPRKPAKPQGEPCEWMETRNRVRGLTAPPDLQQLKDTPRMTS